MTDDDLNRIEADCHALESLLECVDTRATGPLLFSRVGANCRRLLAAVAELAASRENLLRQQAAMQKEVLALRAERDAAGTDSNLASEEILALEAKNAALRALVGAPAPGAPQEPIR